MAIKPLSLNQLAEYYKQNYNMSLTPPAFSTRTQTLPYGGGTFLTPVPSQKPVVTAPPVQKPVVTAPVVQKPVFNQPTPPVQPVQTEQPYQVPPQYINPKTGGLYTAQEIVDNMKKVMPQGDIPKYAGDTLVQGPQTTEQLTGTAAGLNNARNDIATGTTDPYKVASASGVAYSPAEMRAIENAYAGIYDPAINSAYAKLEAKQKADQEAIAQKREELLIKLRTDEDIRQYNATTAVNKTPAQTTEEKQINDFHDDAAKYIEKLGNGEISWATAWNIMRAKYPQASNELIDQMLNKEYYYTVTTN